MSKKQLGQFFTKNSDYILQGFSKYIRGKEITDPFAGDRDLVFWAEKQGAKNVKGFDVDSNYADNKVVFENDSINSPQEYKFVLTNPPYLHKNKATKEIKEKYFQGKNSCFEDLYQVSINSVYNSEEGILIVPLNFLSASNSAKIRKIFFEKFRIIALNIFSEQVFEDTTYNVISFYYRKKEKPFDKNKIKAVIFPDKQKTEFVLEKKYDWQLGGEVISKINSVENFLGVRRLTEKDLVRGDYKIRLAHNNIKDKKIYNIDKGLKELLERNIIFLRAIDSKNGKKIQLEDIRNYKVYGLVGKESSRNMAHLLFEKKIDINTQRELIESFNESLSEERNKHLSLFLTNFRDNNRKRISFDFSYKFINYLYLNKLNHAKKQSILL